MASLPSAKHLSFRSNAGQSLIEILVAVTIGAILVGGTAGLMAIILKGRDQSKFAQGASFLNVQLMDQVQLFAQSKWFCEGGSGSTCSLFTLDKGTGACYMFDPALMTAVIRSCLDASGGGESIQLSGLQFNRIFYVQNVCRNGSGAGAITTLTDNNGVALTCPTDPPDKVDPSTLRVTVVTQWIANGVVKNLTFVKYVTRSQNAAFTQRDWSRGANQSSFPAAIPSVSNGRFYSSNGLSTSTANQIKILGL